MSPNEPATREALLPGRVGLFVRLEANPGARAALLDALHRYTDQLAEEPDTELFLISLDPDNEDVVWLYEWFPDEEGLKRHQTAETFATLVNEVPDLLATPPGLLRVDPLRVHMKTAFLDDTVDAV
ncbi:MAG: antibiotic biosynthesis monooxygenase [Candidatus Nanopelagicales bacterium]